MILCWEGAHVLQQYPQQIKTPSYLLTALPVEHVCSAQGAIGSTRHKEFFRRCMWPKRARIWVHYDGGVYAAEQGEFNIRSTRFTSEWGKEKTRVGSTDGPRNTAQS